MAAGRIDELREEGEEEECGVRVQHVDDHALPEDAVQVVRTLIRDVHQEPVAIEQCPNAEHDQLHRAQPSHDIERERRRYQQRRQAQCGGHHVNERAGADAKHRDETGTTAAAYAARHDIQHCRPRRHQQRERRADENAGMREVSLHHASISSASVCRDRPIARYDDACAMPARCSFKTVESIGRTLPDVEVTTSWGQPTLKVRGKMFACMAANKSAEPNTLVVMMDFADRDALIEDDPAPTT